MNMAIKSHLIALSAFLLLNATPIFAADSGVSAAAAIPATQQQVHYDRATNCLTLHVQDMSLTQLLAQISGQTGVEILMDPTVERPITFSMQDQPLEAGLNKLTRGLNTVMIHDQRDVPGKGRQSMLTTLKLLPAGQTNSALLRPVLSPEAAALLRAKGLDPASRATPQVSERRAARLEKMTPEQRAKLEKQATEKANRKAQNQAARAEQKAKRQQRLEQNITKQLANAQAKMDTNPVFYQQRTQVLTERLNHIQNSPTTRPP
jgi:hypothetical protein